MNEEKLYLSDEQANQLFEKLKSSVDENLNEAVSSLKSVILSEVYSVLKAWTDKEQANDLVKSDIKEVDMLEKPI